MAVTHVATVSAYSDSSVGPLSMSSTLDVATGDYLIGFVGYETRSSSVTVTDGGSISLTVGTEFKHPSSTNYSRMIYGAAASANSTATFTATWDPTCGYRPFILFQFRPDSGDTPSVDDSDVTSGTGTSIASPAISTTGDDVVVVGAMKNWSKGGTLSSYAIGGEAATGASIGSNLGAAWYRILSATASDITATVSHTVSDQWNAHILAVKFTAAAGLSIPVAMHHYRKLRS